jgi:hypothetical protein
MTSSALSNGLKQIKRLFRRGATSVEATLEGREPVATPAPGATSGRLGDPDREGSTNAQMEGAADEPWGGNR